MALKKSIIMGVDGESRNIINNAECAFNIQPENFNSTSQTQLIRFRKKMKY